MAALLDAFQKGAGKVPSKVPPSVRVVGWHMGGAASSIPEARSGPTPQPHPLVAMLKRRLDPDGRLPPWPGA